MVNLDGTVIAIVNFMETEIRVSAAHIMIAEDAIELCGKEAHEKAFCFNKRCKYCWAPLGDKLGAWAICMIHRSFPSCL